MFDKLKLYARELKSFSAFFDQANAGSRNIVFYSEKDIYYQYFEGLIEYLLANSEHAISYLTSDPDDPLFGCREKRLKLFYINQLLPAVMKKLDAVALIMTMPDLGQFHIKRSPKTAHHIYLFHAIVSSHLQYRQGAFDNYDTIFCVGPHHLKEIRRTEEVYALKPKTLIESGYHRLEKIHREHKKFGPKAGGQRPLILVAPTWGETSLLETSARPLISVLAKSPYDVVIRPHPEFLKRRADLVTAIRKQVDATANLSLETDLVSDRTIHQADVLITDRSGIAFEYAFGTERPVLFIDTPLKVQNPEYEKLGIEPLEISSRKSLGRSLELNKLDEIPGVLAEFLNQKEKYRHQIVEYRQRSVSHWMRSASIEGEYILSLVGQRS